MAARGGEVNSPDGRNNRRLEPEAEKLHNRGARPAFSLKEPAVSSDNINTSVRQGSPWGGPR